MPWRSDTVTGGERDGRLDQRTHLRSWDARRSRQWLIAEQRLQFVWILGGIRRVIRTAGSRQQETDTQLFPWIAIQVDSLL
jgi:hypothetical protein